MSITENPQTSCFIGTPKNFFDIAVENGNLSFEQAEELLKRFAVKNSNGNFLQFLLKTKLFTKEAILAILGKIKDESKEKEEEILKINISKDKMLAQVLSYNGDLGDFVFELKKRVKELGISFGLISDKELSQFLENPKFPLIFAKGEIPLKTTEISLTNIFSATKYLILKPNSKGNYEIETIQKGDIFKSNGIIGKDIFGEFIFVKDGGTDFLEIQGRGKVKRRELFDKRNGCHFQFLEALVSGIPCENENGFFVLTKAVIEDHLLFEELKSLFGKKVFLNLDIRGSARNVMISCLDLDIKGPIENCRFYVRNFTTVNDVNDGKISANGNVTLNTKNINNISIKSLETVSSISTFLLNINNSHLSCAFLGNPDCSAISNINLNSTSIISKEGFNVKYINGNCTINFLQSDFKIIKSMYQEVRLYLLVLKKISKLLESEDNDVDNDKKKKLQEELLPIIEKVSEIMTETLGDIDLKNISASNLIKLREKLKNIYLGKKTILLSLVKKFLEKKSKNPSIKILKCLNPIKIKTAGKTIEFETNSYVKLYENLYLKEDGSLGVLLEESSKEYNLGSFFSVIKKRN